MKQLMFERKGRLIKNLETGEVTDFKTINKAKRESLSLQRFNGGVGRGSLRVVAKFTESSAEQAA